MKRCEYYGSFFFRACTSFGSFCAGVALGWMEEMAIEF